MLIPGWFLLYQHLPLGWVRMIRPTVICLGSYYMRILLLSQGLDRLVEEDYDSIGLLLGPPLTSSILVVNQVHSLASRWP